MNATNRAVNRIVLCVVGLVLFAAGAITAAAAVSPDVRGYWESFVDGARTWLVDTDAATRIHESTTLSWLSVGALALLVVIVAVAVLIVARLGGGRSSTVTRSEAIDGAIGPVTVLQGFAQDALGESLHRDESILAAKITTSRIRGEDVLHVAVTPRQNASPIVTARTVTTLVDNLARLTGAETPTFVSIHAGLRSKLAADQARVR